MKKVVIFAILIVLCCSRVSLRMKSPLDLYLKTEKNIPVYRCGNSITELLFVESDLPQKIKDMVARSAEYWNSLGSRKLFLYSGDTVLGPEDPESGGFIVIGDMPTELKERYRKEKDEGAKKTLGVTALRYNEDTGCISEYSIFLDVERLISVPDMQAEIAIRHELGHTLGFHHSERNVDLMYKSVVKDPNKIKEMSDWEIEAYNIFYK